MLFLRHLLKWIIYITLALIVLSILQVLAFKWVPVPRTPLMISRAWEYRHDEAFKTHYNWTPLDKLSRQLPLAVIASEDNRFETHSGFDWVEIDKALNKEKRKRPRGASTITQQVAKNVFLWQGRSWLRKGIEAYYTVLVEFMWSKERIMEVYLNVAEMGKGIYGAEAAAQIYYKKPATKLTSSEAAMLAACLPSPLKRNPTKPTSYLRQRQQTIMSLMNKIGQPEFLIH